ncbi:hypothetical protein DUNSADRAFT_7607 [Dunaliella salina]|uniref:Uncharacterized protein n=1 Tax=Dunaliella salina TaxID=3046 RepID=A0ABQ7GKZ3_DUNSA|nr:hypothetical protein DUNSADRAFT_7607 [Dunaliella salina]|eukprot:KAF5835282.1 hypothetical protein DUNSADRAFT_7607 [Dunaliella salina]
MGMMSLRGVGMPRNKSAYLCAGPIICVCVQAAERGYPDAYFYMGMMSLRGVGMPRNKSAHLCAGPIICVCVQAAEQGYPDAYFYMGMMNLRGLGMRRKSVQRALSYLTLAAHVGHVQAMYNTAMLHLTGKGTVRNCKPASNLLKHASEKSPTAAVLQEGHELFFRGHYQQALWKYLQAGEVGMELGMANAAWLMARGYAQAGGLMPNVTFRLHKRSAAQGNVASLLAMGDAYFYGSGVELDWRRASAIYYEVGGAWVQHGSTR